MIKTSGVQPANSVSLNDRRIAIPGGELVDPFDPNPFMGFEEITATLDNICRWGGRCRPFFSVLQHSLILSFIVPEEYALHALVHDFSEAYLMDVSRPIKEDPVFEKYRAIEKELDAKIWFHYAGFKELPEIVSYWDHRLSYREASLLGLRGDWMNGGVKPAPIHFDPAGPGETVQAFAERWELVSQKAKEESLLRM